MMTHEEIEERQIVDRYVMDRLTSDEREAFEDLLLEDPELMDRVEVATAFRRDLKRAMARDLENRVALGLMARLLGARTMRATSALLAAALLLIVFLPSESVPEMAAVTVATLETVRADDPFSVNRITLAEDAALVLTDQLIDPDAETVRVTVRNTEGEISDTRLFPAEGETIDLALGRLQPGRYTLSLECARQDTAFELFAQFGFEILRP